MCDRPTVEPMELMEARATAVRLFQRLRAAGLRLASAESCTGGLIGAILTQVAGISEVYPGGFIVYENAAKTALLGVPEALLAAHGAVSEECAGAMVTGAAHMLHADCAVATTGIAGPGGGSAAKPVGTVCIGFAVNGRVHTETCHFKGDRSAVRAQAVQRALAGLLELLAK